MASRRGSCYDCGETKQIRIRQCDFWLCDECNDFRQKNPTVDPKTRFMNKSKETHDNGLTKYVASLKNPKKLKDTKFSTPNPTTTKSKTPGNVTSSVKKTSSGHWRVAETPDKVSATTPCIPKVTNQAAAADSGVDKIPPIPCSDQSCRTQPGDLTCDCFICQKDFHLACVNLTRRPARSSNWCCEQCRDVPKLLRELRNTISILSDWQRTMYDQQIELKAENNALKEQINEIMKQNQHITVVKKADPVKSSESDISLTDNEREGDGSSWADVVRRHKKRRVTVSQAIRREINPQQSHKRTINRHDTRERSYNVSRDRKLRGMDQEPLQRSRQQSRKVNANYNRHRPRNQNMRTRKDGYNDDNYLPNRNMFSQRARARGETSRAYNSPSYDSWEPCYNCGLTNHGTKDCYYLHPVTCRSCGQLGHKSKSCSWYGSRFYDN